MAYEAVSRAIAPSRRRTCCGSLTSYVCPRHRIVVGRRVRRRPAVITHGTAIAATAVRHAGTFQAPATGGAAEKRARRRKKAFATEAGRGAKKIAAGVRLGPPQSPPSDRPGLPYRNAPL